MIEQPWEDRSILAGGYWRFLTYHSAEDRAKFMAAGVHCKNPSHRDRQEAECSLN